MLLGDRLPRSLTGETCHACSPTDLHGLVKTFADTLGLLTTVKKDPGIVHPLLTTPLPTIAPLVSTYPCAAFATELVFAAPMLDGGTAGLLIGGHITHGSKEAPIHGEVTIILAYRRTPEDRLRREGDATIDFFHAHRKVEPSVDWITLIKGEVRVSMPIESTFTNSPWSADTLSMKGISAGEVKRVLQAATRSSPSEDSNEVFQTNDIPDALIASLDQTHHDLREKLRSR